LKRWWRREKDEVSWNRRKNLDGKEVEAGKNEVFGLLEFLVLWSSQSLDLLSILVFRSLGVLNFIVPSSFYLLDLLISSIVSSFSLKSLSQESTKTNPTLSPHKPTSELKKVATESDQKYSNSDPLKQYALFSLFLASCL
jgi:hypothetical protein